MAQNQPLLSHMSYSSPQIMNILAGFLGSITGGLNSLWVYSCRQLQAERAFK